MQHRDFAVVTTSVTLLNPSSEEGFAEDTKAVVSIRNVTSVEPIKQHAA